MDSAAPGPRAPAASDLLEIVVPAYGRSPLLTETLRSLSNFVPEGIRLSVLDDATPGLEVADQVSPFAGRISYWRNERNLGVSGAFNEAARRATAEFLVLVGPDDRGVPRMIDTYLAGIARFPTAAAIHPSVRPIDEAGRPSSNLTDRTKALLRPAGGREYSGERLAERLLLGNWTYNPAIAWRCELVRRLGFAVQLHTAMDLDLLLRLAFTGESVALVDELGLEYRRHSGAVSSMNAGSKRLREELRIHAEAATRAREMGWRRARLAAVLAPTARLHGTLVALRGPRAQRRETLGLALASASRLRG